MRLRRTIAAQLPQRGPALDPHTSPGAMAMLLPVTGSKGLL